MHRRRASAGASRFGDGRLRGGEGTGVYRCVNRSWKRVASARRASYLLRVRRGAGIWTPIEMAPALTDLKLPPVPDAARRLERCLRVLIEDFGAEEIWLYGSVSRGEAGPDSDVDLLVVGGQETGGRSARHRAARLLAHVQGSLPLGLNVVTPAQWVQLRSERSTLYPEIAEKGVKLYARKPD